MPSLTIPVPAVPLAHETTTSPRWRTSICRGRTVGDYYDANTWKFLLSTRSGRSTASCGAPASRAAERRCTTPTPWCSTSSVAATGACSTSAAASAPPRCTSRGGGRSRSSASRTARRRFASRTGSPRAPGPLQGQGALRGRGLHRAAGGLAGFDLAFAIESFVHADPAAAFFAQAAHALRPGGALVVIDDVRATDRRIPRSRTSRPAGTSRACSPSPRSRRTPPAPG